MSSSSEPGGHEGWVDRASWDIGPIRQETTCDRPAVPKVQRSTAAFPFGGPNYFSLKSIIQQPGKKQGSPLPGKEGKGEPCPPEKAWTFAFPSSCASSMLDSGIFVSCSVLTSPGAKFHSQNGSSPQTPPAPKSRSSCNPSCRPNRAERIS